MEDSATAQKLPQEKRFTDLSDYARPLAIWIAYRLRDTAVTAPTVTLVWAVIGLAGTACYAAGDYGLAVMGTLGLQAKNVLDAVDGSLARVQRRPSRIGRFLDTDLDAVVAAALYAALAVDLARSRPVAFAVILAVSALVLGLLQGSVFNYYYVLYRARSGGDTTSHLRESLTEEDEGRYAARPAARTLLRALIAVYNRIYGWQDDMVRKLDGWAARPLRRAGRPDLAAELRDDRRLLTAVSALGPGFQILVLNVITLWGRGRLATAIELFLWIVAVGGTLYAVVIIVLLRVKARRAAAAVV